MSLVVVSLVVVGFSRRELRNLVVENDKNCLCSFVTVGVPYYASAYKTVVSNRNRSLKSDWLI